MAQTLPATVVAACERVCLAYRSWAPGESRAPDVGETLSGGRSNLSVLLRGTRKHWVLRVPRGPAPPGVCRRRELAIHRHAAAAGLAPAPVYADPATGLLVTPRLAPAAGDDIGEIAALLRSIHALPAIEAATASPLDGPCQLRHWRERLGPADPLARLPQATLVALADACTRVSAGAPARVICHNDLLHANRLMCAGRLVAIDWEYARCGDAFFDLAVAASEYAPDQRERLLVRYLERPPTRDERRHFDDQRLVYLAIAACWHAGEGFPSADIANALEAITRAVAEASAAMSTPRA